MSIRGYVYSQYYVIITSLKRSLLLLCLICEIGDEVFGYRWFQKTKNGQYKYVCEDVFTKVKESCNHTSFYQLIMKEGKIDRVCMCVNLIHYCSLFKFVIAADHETQSCEFEIAHSLRYQSTNNVLFFASPTVNDTGEMLCNSNSDTNGHGSSIYIAVGKLSLHYAIILSCLQ
jgi:hypothetical protein